MTLEIASAFNNEASRAAPKCSNDSQESYANQESCITQESYTSNASTTVDNWSYYPQIGDYWPTPNWKTTTPVITTPVYTIPIDKDGNPLYDPTQFIAPPTLEPSNVAAFKKVANALAELYRRKNADYGDSFSKSVDKYGTIAALTRISDKFNRLESLIMGREQLVDDESINDTLLDLASYCIMTVVAINGDEQLKNLVKKLEGS